MDFERALDRLLPLQRADGCWEGEMVWNAMIVSQYVLVRSIVHAAGGRPLDEETRAGIVHHLTITQAEDGSWGMHPESQGYVFFTTLAYVALRLCGVGPDEKATSRALAWLRAQPGGVPSIPTWGKYWLAFVGLYEWSGCNPISPELFLLPRAVPIHPDHYYCHTRYIYAGLAYLYGTRFRRELPLSPTLRAELYDNRYAEVDFRAHRHDVAPSDLYVAPGRGVKLAQDALDLGDGILASALRPRAIAGCLERIRFEQRASNYQAISPVNGLLNCLALFAHANDPRDPELSKSLDGVEAWRWSDAREGVRFCGARSNTWDTAFAMQAMLALPSTAALPARTMEPLRRAYRYLSSVQIRQELEGGAAAGRDPALGGFCFSDGAHRWPVSDCTAEALSAILAAEARPGLIPASDRIGRERLAQAATFILSRQNDDGGFGTYERRRGGAMLEKINPTEMYGQCMTERSYLECTASSLRALAELRHAYPDVLPARIDEARRKAEAFLRQSQRSDGSWPGFWGINFTYAIFHVTSALRANGASAGDPAIQRAATFVEAHQMSEPRGGGWGEHWRSCLDETYRDSDTCQSVMTSWALLALDEAGRSGTPAAHRGRAFLSRYLEAPERWPDAVNGVFFGSAMLDYRYYRYYFPVWALARAS